MTKAFKRSILVLVVTSTALVCITFFGISLFNERRSYTCGQCSSRKDVWQWRFGAWMSASIPLSRKKMIPHDSAALATLFGPSHEHIWEFAQGSPHFSIWSGCAIGRGRHINQFAHMYETQPEFRSFLSDEVKQGTLMQIELRHLIFSNFDSSETDYFFDAAAREQAMKLQGEYESTH